MPSLVCHPATEEHVGACKHSWVCIEPRISPTPEAKSLELTVPLVALPNNLFALPDDMHRGCFLLEKAQLAASAGSQAMFSRAINKALVFCVS